MHSDHGPQQRCSSLAAAALMCHMPRCVRFAGMAGVASQGRPNFAYSSSNVADNGRAVTAAASSSCLVTRCCVPRHRLDVSHAALLQRRVLDGHVVIQALTKNGTAAGPGGARRPQRMGSRRHNATRPRLLDCWPTNLLWFYYHRLSNGTAQGGPHGCGPSSSVPAAQLPRAQPPSPPDFHAKGEDRPSRLGCGTPLRLRGRCSQLGLSLTAQVCRCGILKMPSRIFRAHHHRLAPADPLFRPGDSSRRSV